MHFNFEISELCGNRDFFHITNFDYVKAIVEFFFFDEQFERDF